jgi:copper homeostasis protein
MQNKDFSRKKVLEICCYSLKSCKNAQAGGADRIELCGSMPEGGITPSIGLIERALQEIKIPIYVMIRPRGGDFLYSKEEIEVMLSDIKTIKKLKPAGFVIGLLKSDGNLDLENTKLLLNEIGDFPVTFHRAFDMCVNPTLAIEQLISLGIENILTSGQFQTAPEGIENLKTYKHIASNRINIMAGSGVNPKNIELIANTGADALHFSAKKSISSGMVFRNKNINMGDKNADEYATYEADENLVREAKQLIEKLYKA